jgi:hypothetical protein
MEKPTPQTPRKLPTTKHYLSLFFSVFALGATFLTYFKYQYSNLHLRYLFQESAASIIPASAVSSTETEFFTSSPTSNIKGKKFDRFVSIWLENQDYDIAAADR